MRNLIVCSETCFGRDRAGESTWRGEERGERAIVSYSLIVMFMPCLETIKLRDNIRNDS